MLTSFPSYTEKTEKEDKSTTILVEIQETTTDASTILVEIQETTTEATTILVEIEGVMLWILLMIASIV